MNNSKLIQTSPTPGSWLIKPLIAIAIIAGSLAAGSVPVRADNNGYAGDNYGFGSQKGPKMKSGNYCTSGATAYVVANEQHTTVAIKGNHPDRRGVAGYARNGFSGEGFSIVPIFKKKIRIDQSRYGISRTFKRC